MADMLAMALAYAARGWHVFPLVAGGKVPYGGSHGHKDATTHKGKIRQWWKQTPNANIAIATGKRSGIFVLDEDPRHGGDKTLEELEAEHGKLPRTVMVETPRRGFHRYFSYPGRRVKNSQSMIGPGLDIRGDGGHVAAPPSIVKRRGQYRFVEGHSPDDLPIAEASAWLLAMLNEGKDNDDQLGSGGTENTEAISVLSVVCVPTIDDAIRLTLPEHEGQRNDYIFPFGRALKAMPRRPR